MIDAPGRIITYAFLVTIGGFVFGFDAAVIGGTVGYIATLFDLSPWQIGLVVSAPTLAAIVSSFTIGIVSDLIGRKIVLIMLAALYVVSAIMSAFAWSFWPLVFARAIGGYAFGALTQAPTYIAEISPAHSRGRLVAINQMTIVTGISAAYFSNLAIQSLEGNSFITASNAWRVMLGIEAVPAMIWLVALFFIPESPRWLATQSRWSEVRAVLQRLNTTAKENIEAVISELKCDVGEVRLPIAQRLSVLVSKKARYALLIGLIIAIVQQITGINTVFFYATTIFEQSGVGKNAAFTQAVFVGLINIAFTLLAMMLIDKIGRRPLMIIGLAGVALSMATISWGFNQAKYVLDDAAIEQVVDLAPEDADFSAIKDQVFESDITFKQAVSGVVGTDVLRDNESAFIASAMNANSRLILFGVLSFVASFAMSLGPVMWVYLAEIFPNHVRGVAISFVTVFNSGASWFVQFLFPIQLSTSGIAGVFAGYSLFGLIGLVLIWWLMPETKGLTLEQVTKRMSSHSIGKKG